MTEPMPTMHRAGTAPPGTILISDPVADGAYFGMQTFDQSLLRLQQKGLVSFQAALNNATDPSDFKLAVQALGLKSA
jgi:twitching motility protein PilT